MRRMFPLSLVLAASLAITACGPRVSEAPPGPGSGPPSAPAVPTQQDTLIAIGGTAAAIADALQVAPPATITSKTTIDEKAVRLAFLSFEGTLVVINERIDANKITFNSPNAVKMRDAILLVKDGLVAASAAQRAGQAASYRQGLVQAQIALAALRSAIASQGAVS